jgi:Mce-associated membrane protein
VIDADRVADPPQDPDRAAGAAKARALAEEAEAEAAEAEAIAAAARAKARALRLRREADAAEAAATDDGAAEAEGSAPEDTEATSDDDATDGTETEPKSETDAGTDEAAAVADADDAVESPEESPAGPRRRFPVGRILRVTAAVLTVACTCALITLSVLMVLHHRNVVRDQQRSAEYAAAARQSVVTLMSLDFNKANEDVQRIIDNSTGQFKDDFQNNAPDFIKVAQDSKVVTDVAVNATAVDSMTNDTATVLVSATSRVTNSAGAKQDPRSWRLSVDLKRDGGQIKMSKVEFVP